MRRRVTLLVAAIGSALLAGGCSKAPPPKAKHLVLITVDTLRTDRLGSYGGTSGCSPFLDALAARGVRFANAYCQRAMTLPSMTTWFTSRYVAEHGVNDNKKRVPEEERLLAERLAEAGFATRCYNATPVLEPESGIAQGFAPGDYRMFPDEAEMTRGAARYIERRFGHDGRRDFLWLHYMNPHKPYDPPGRYKTMFVDGGREVDVDPARLDRIYVEKTALTEEERRDVEGAYDGTVAFVNDLVASVVDALEERGLMEETLLVFSADHGEDLYSHNAYFWHANSPYRSSTHVPLLFVQPGTIPAGRVEDGLVETTDFLPTVLTWLGVGGADDGDPALRPRGHDLTGVLLGETSPRRDTALSELDVVNPLSECGDEGAIWAIRNRRWSFVWNDRRIFPDNPPSEGFYPIAAQELYDLEKDPDEQLNVVADHPDVADRMYEALLARTSTLTFRTLEDETDDARMKKLAELGYVLDEQSSRPTYAPPANDADPCEGRE
ncbi:MAG: sulfatase [Planctomycetota bacterium JB042]